MDFEVYKEQLLEALKSYKNKIQDSDIYITVKERYDNLSPNIQKLILFSAVFFVVYFFYSIPAGLVSSAEEKMTYFSENRQLTRELIRAGRIDRTVKLPPPAPSFQDLESQVESKLKFERVLEEQKLTSTQLDKVATSAIVPKSIKQTGLKTSLKQLNLKQLIRIGEAMSEIPSSELLNLSIQADSKDPHYFNVEYEMAAFSVPQIEKKAPALNKKKRSKKRKSKFKKKKAKK